MSLNKDEFRQICQTIAGPSRTDRIDKNTLYTAVCCAGKSVIRSHLDNLWPEDKREVDYDHAFRIFERLEDLVVDKNDMDKILKQEIRIDVEQLLDQVAVNKRDSIKSSLLPFIKDGCLDLEEFIQAVETTKHETLAWLLQIQQQTSGNATKQMWDEANPTEEEAELELKPTFRGVLFTNPLRVVKHQFDGDGPTRITLRVEWNSDMGTNKFENDIFGIVTDTNGRVIAVTSRFQNGTYKTDEFLIEPGTTFSVMGLATNTRITSRDKQRVDLTSEDKLSKRFKMTLMNIFDMFDFDCDGLLSRDEYAAFAIATADTPPDDEEWDLLTSQFDARDGGLTMVGFLFMHECEAFSGDDLAVPDIWESLYRLGYDNSLQLQHACPFSIVVENEHDVASSAHLSSVTRIERANILKGLYDCAEVDNGSDLGARIFRADYFGMMIIRTGRIENIEHNIKTYRVDIVEEKNVKWNFVHGKDDIDPSKSGDWMLVCSYRSTADNHVAEFHFIEEPTTSSI